MKVQIVGFRYSATNAMVEVKLPDGPPNSIITVALPTNKVLTKKELVVSIMNTLTQLEEMSRRLQIVKDLHLQEIEVK